MANNSVTLRLEHHLDDECSYNGITDVSADIIVSNRNVGSIGAVLVDRQRIPDRRFYSSFDEKSADLQWIGCALMEPILGRTKLRSLAEYDDTELDFMYISTFHVDEAYKSNSDVATNALHQFLHHPFLNEKVSSVAYVLDPCEAMSQQDLSVWKNYTSDCQKRRYKQHSVEEKIAHQEEQKQWDARREVFSRQDANPFLRNGFFQDPAISKSGGSEARILVASNGHFSAPLKTHAEALAVTFCTPDQTQRAPTGKSAELFEFLKSGCRGQGDASIRPQIQTYVREGASLADSEILHVACANNTFDVVQMILDLDPTLVNRANRVGATPLMTAASAAPGRHTISGIAEVNVIDYLLVKGANKALRDRSGMTAYGHFENQTKGYDVMMQAMTGRPVGQGTRDRSQRAILAKLMPPGGPAPNDLTGGKNPGIMDYSAEDREAGLEMGDFDDSDGDY